jgi:flagellar hook-associated protein 2
VAGATIVGGASGLDTAALVAQLMQLERGPQTKLQSSLTKQKSANSALQTLNSVMANLATKADALSKPAAYSPLTAKSSIESVTVTAKSGSSAGIVDIQVLSTAAAHRAASATTAAPTDVVVPGGTKVVLNIAGTDKTIETGDGTLDGLVKALNAAGTGVQATTVGLADGTRRLYVTSGATGAEGTFTLKAENGDPLTIGLNVVTDGRDASIKVGQDTITSKSNSFAGAVEGVDITVSEESVGKSATVTIGVDATKMTADVKAMVDKLNEAIAYADSAYGNGGALERNSTVRSTRSTLVNTLFGKANESLSGVGVEIDRYGKFIFNEEKFSAAYVANPATTAALFVKENGDGFAQRINDAAKIASDKYDGVITSAIKGGASKVTDLEASIKAWDSRLVLRQSSLERQFTAMEVALSKMQSQGNWLSSQIGSMTANN